MSPLFFVALLALVYAGPATADWFGVKPPESATARNERDWAAYTKPDFPPLVLPAPVKDPFQAITDAEVHGHLTDIIRITTDNRPPNEPFWGRIAGSPAERQTAAWLTGQFRDAGLESVREEPVKGGPQWWPTRWSVTLVADEASGATADYTLSSAFPALHLGEGAMNLDKLEAGLVYAGMGEPADLAGRDLAGKIAIVRSVMQPDPFFQSARGLIPALVKAGAAGVIVAIDAPGNFQYALEKLSAKEIPSFVVGGEDGRFLQQVLGAAGSRPVRVRLAMHSEVRPSWEGLNAVGEIPGKGDETVLVIAHLDGYFEGANDNAGGVASLAALARYFNEQSGKLQRRHVFVGTSAHHEFSDGVSAFIAAHPDLMAKTRLVVNLEHPSSNYSYYRGPLRIGPGVIPGQLVTTTGTGSRSVSISNGNPKLTAIYRDAIQRHGMVVDSMANRMPSGDAFAFFRAGIPVVQIIDTNLWFHASADRIGTIDPAGLGRATRLYAEVLAAIDRESAETLGLERRR